MMKRNNILIIVEVLVMGGIVFGWFAPLLFPSEEDDEASQRWDGHFVIFVSGGEGFFNTEVRRGYTEVRRGVDGVELSGL